MLAVTCDETGVVLAVNVLPVAPVGTVTEAGTVTAELSLERTITAPPIGAGPFRSTVTPNGVPPTVLPTVASNPPSSGSIMIVFFNVRAALVAVIRGVTSWVTAAVVMGKLALVAPPCTVTAEGNDNPASGNSTDSANVAPSAGAAELSVMVAVDFAPPKISCGESWNEFTVCSGLNGARPAPNGL